MGNCQCGGHNQNHENEQFQIITDGQNENESLQINAAENSIRFQQKEQNTAQNKSGNVDWIKQAQSEYLGQDDAQIIILNDEFPWNSKQSLDNKKSKQIRGSCIESTTQLLVGPNQQSNSQQQQKSCNQQSLIQHGFVQSNVRQLVQQHNQSQH